MLGFQDRQNRPRKTGLNCTIDCGLPTNLFEDYVTSFSPFIDAVKFGWGTGVISPDLDKKLEILTANDIPYWFGGTTFEVAYKSRKLDEYCEWLLSKNTEIFEISDGVIEINSIERIRLIEDLSKKFEVYTEVGSKDANQIYSPSHWVEFIQSDFASGASYVILEGRENGNSGIFRPDGEVRTGLIDDIEFSGIPMNRLIIEAPRNEQQVWFIKRFGRRCNFANIAFEDVVNLETLRRGLRSDTFGG